MKHSITFLLLSFCVFTLHSQIITIPDINFKNALVFENVVDTTGNGLGDAVADTNGDGEIQIAEAEAVTSLIVSYYEIVSLQGIENFANLEVLKSRGNFVETVDLSSNIHLKWIHLSTNPLVNIDVSQNINLEKLWIYNNELTSLDVSQNPNLNSLRCYTNSLSSLNIANKNNELLLNFLAFENPNLNCIEVDNTEFANEQIQWQIDDFALYSENCNLNIYSEREIDFMIFPNPVKDFFYIDSKIPYFKSIQIINIAGKVVKEVNQTNKIDVSSLNPSIYFVQITFAENFVTKKMIKI